MPAATPASRKTASTVHSKKVSSPLSLSQYLQKILTSRVYEVAIESALVPAQQMSARLGHHVWMKREDMQPVHSFKLRGAYNKMAQLPAKALK